MKQVYTIEEIKRAFWAQFHKSGELWFSYFEDEPDYCDYCTERYWEGFLSKLHRGVEQPGSSPAS